MAEHLLAAPHANAYDWAMQNSRAKLDELPQDGFVHSRVGQLVRLLFGLAWDVVRLPALTLLVIVEPLVQFVLTANALLLVLTAAFFKLIVHRPDFPFWGMLALSVGCVWVLALYYAIIRVLGLRGAVGPAGR